MKRIFWLFNGYLLGLGTSIWAQRRLRRAADRFTPEEIRRQMTERTRDLADLARQTALDLRDAATEGRTAMRDSALDLQAEFGARPGASALRPSRAPNRPRNAAPTAGPRRPHGS